MELNRVKEVWQLALVYQVRSQTLLNDIEISKKNEFDEDYGKTYNYILMAQNEEAIVT